MDWLIVLVVLPFVLGFVGGIVKLSVLGKKPWNEAKFSWFQRFYFRTLAWHPVLVGPLVGLAFWAFHGPVPAVFGDSLLGYVLAGLFASGVTIIGYALIVKTIRRMIGAAGALVGAGGASSPSDEGSTEDRP